MILTRSTAQSSGGHLVEVTRLFTSEGLYKIFHWRLARVSEQAGYLHKFLNITNFRYSNASPQPWFEQRSSVCSAAEENWIMGIRCKNANVWNWDIIRHVGGHVPTSVSNTIVIIINITTLFIRYYSAWKYTLHHHQPGKEVQYSTIQYNTVQYITLLYNTLQYFTIQYSTNAI